MRSRSARQLASFADMLKAGARDGDYWAKADDFRENALVSRVAGGGARKVHDDFG